MNKISRYLGGLVTMLLAGMVGGCVTEDLKPDSSAGSQSTEYGMFDLPGVMTVNIRLGESTRAVSDFVNKEANEKELALAPSTDAEAYHYALLYKETGDNDNPVAVLKLDTREVVQAADNKKDTDLSKDMTVAVKKVYANTEFGEECKTLEGFRNYLNSISTVYVLVNFDPKNVTRIDKENEKDPDLYSSTHEYLMDLPIKSVQQLEVNNYVIKAKDYNGDDCEYFTMSSSIYQNADWVVVAASDIDSSKIYFTEENALNGEPTIKGIIERLAVKYELGVTYESGKYLKKSGTGTVPLFKSVSTSGDFEFTTLPVTWSAEVVGYGMNAIEPTERVIKNFQYISGVNTEGFNDVPNKRCYWSKDPHYTIEGSSLLGYPHQYRDPLETDTIRPYQIKENPGITTNNPIRFLKYFSYNQFKTDPSKSVYTLENTYDDRFKLEVKDGKIEKTQGIGPYNYYSAGTHYILACVLRLDNQGIRDLYRDEDEVYYDSKADLLNAKLTLLNDRDLVGGSSDTRILNVDWGYSSDPSHSYDKDLRIIEWPKEARLYYSSGGGVNDAREVTINDLDLIPAYITGGDGKVMIAPKSSLTGQFYLKSNTESKEISRNELISLFHKTMGAFEYFKNGMMYYCAPVTHFVNQVTPESWKNIGDVGAVRNNWYKINVLSVKAPGHSVAVAEQPIIPMHDIDRDYMSTQVIIYRWHEVPKSVEQYPNFLD